MTDTPETPDSAAGEPHKPTPRRRAALRPSDTTKPRAARKPVVAKADEAVTRGASATRDAAVEVTAKVKKAVKPRSGKRATPPTKRAAGKKMAAKAPAARSTVAKAADRIGGGWGAAAIVSGVAGVAALLTLRGSTRVADAAKKLVGGEPSKHAHQADGTDSSASFAAGIADEGTIPENS